MMSNKKKEKTKKEYQLDNLKGAQLCHELSFFLNLSLSLEINLSQ